MTFQANAFPSHRHAPAKVNSRCACWAKRADGYHDLESLVVFAGLADRVTLAPGAARAGLDVDGPTAGAAGDVSDNLVLRAARALADRVPGLQLGRFALTKRLPVAAGPAAARRPTRPPRCGCWRGTTGSIAATPA
jgi:4-diphosphocytidyl-2-C-methyl-D-erythritol kinase